MPPPRLAFRWRALTTALLLSGLLAGPGALVAAAAPSPAPPAGGLPRPQAIQASAAALRAKLDAQNTRLEVLAEDLDEAYTWPPPPRRPSAASGWRWGSAPPALTQTPCGNSRLTRRDSTGSPP